MSRMENAQFVIWTIYGMVKKLILFLDHIDGNAANNDRSNMRLICPNCDSQLGYI